LKNTELLDGHQREKKHTSGMFKLFAIKWDSCYIFWHLTSFIWRLRLKTCQLRKNHKKIFLCNKLCVNIS
jgi:hypothetical protein